MSTSKVSTYYYISSQGHVRTSSFTCPKDHWKIVRYNLETNNGEFVNTRTYLKGYPCQADILQPNMDIQLNENIDVPDVFFVHRLPLLPGMKSFFPASQYPKYQHLQVRLETLKEEIQDVQKESLQRLMSQNIFSSSQIPARPDTLYQDMVETSREIFDTLKSFEEKEGYHSSKISIKYETIEPYDGVVQSIATAVPPVGYICKTCGASDHFRDVCNRDVHKLPVEFGAAKMKKFVLSDQPEERDLTNLYLKVFQPK
jgi:hypothetical protein